MADLQTRLLARLTAALMGFPPIVRIGISALFFGLCGMVVYDSVVSSSSSGPLTCSSERITSTLTDLINRQSQGDDSLKVLNILKVESFSPTPKNVARFNVWMKENGYKPIDPSNVSEGDAILATVHGLKLHPGNPDDHREECGADLITNHGDKAILYGWRIHGSKMYVELRFVTTLEWFGQSQ